MTIMEEGPRKVPRLALEKAIEISLPKQEDVIEPPKKKLLEVSPPLPPNKAKYGEMIFVSKRKPEIPSVEKVNREEKKKGMVLPYPQAFPPLTKMEDGSFEIPPQWKIGRKYLSEHNLRVMVGSCNKLRRSANYLESLGRPEFKSLIEKHRQVVSEIMLCLS